MSKAWCGSAGLSVAGSVPGTEDGVGRPLNYTAGYVSIELHEKENSPCRT